MNANEVITYLLRRWRTLAAITVLGVAGAAVYAFVAPQWFEARLTVIPSKQRRMPDLSNMGIASLLPEIGGLDSSADVQRIRAVLTSTSVTDEVITRFNLQDRYEEAHIEKTREELWKHCSVAVDKKSNVVALTCEDKDPKRAKEMVGYFGEVGNRVFGRVSVSSAREERAFLETQMQKARADVAEASRRLRDFQEKHKVIDLPEQSKAVISAMASIKGELMSKQLQLSYLTSFSSSTESSVGQLRQQISILSSKLDQLEKTSGAYGKTPPNAAGSGATADFFPNAMNVPELRFELEQLFREQKIQETVFFLLTQRYESAKVDEARDTSTFQILDYPTLPTFRARPHRLKVIVAGGIGAFMAAVALFVALPLLRSRASRTEGMS